MRNGDARFNPSRAEKPGALPEAAREQALAQWHRMLASLEEPTP